MRIEEEIDWEEERRTGEDYKGRRGEERGRMEEDIGREDE